MKDFGYIQVREFVGMGRGIQAQYPIHKGTTILIQDILVLNEHDTKLLEQTDLKYYKYKFNETQDCLVLGYGELFNHSDTPNIRYWLHGNTMHYEAIKDIKTGEQLFINYKQDDDTIDISEYTVNMV